MQLTSVDAAGPALAHDSKAFYGIFLVGFVLFLMIAVVAENAGVAVAFLVAGAEGNHSLIGDVKGAVYTFMSHLL